MKQSTLIMKVSPDTNTLQLMMMGGILKLPIENKEITLIESANKINNFMTELFAIEGVKEVFEKHGASFNKLD